MVVEFTYIIPNVNHRLHVTVANLLYPQKLTSSRLRSCILAILAAIASVTATLNLPLSTAGALDSVSALHSWGM